MALKSIPEIAFDAFQTFASTASPNRVFKEHDGKYATWEQLYPGEKLIFERIASRIQAEMALRSAEVKKQDCEES